MTQRETSLAALRLTLLGPMQVWVHGQSLPPLRSRKPLWLLALLTLRPNRPVAREWLAGTLWPDAHQSQAFANLRPVLSELRKALATEGKRLLSPDRHTLRLDLTGAEVDIVAFEAAIARGTRSDLELAVGLYRGPLLEGCDEEWVFQEREAREQVYLQTLQTLGDESLAGGDYAPAAGYYQQAVRIDPWREDARRGWMEALAKMGDTNAALQVYREFVAFLKDDPKAVPDEQTSSLYQRLRAEVRQRAGAHAVVTAQTPALPVVQGYLPHPLTDLVGREDERLEVALQLRRSRLVTLTGVGGIGKTRLARAVASEVVREYVDGVWLVALEALTEGRLVIQQIASVLGLQEERGRTPLHTVTEYLRNKRLLLVLDNCEHLLEASAQVTAHLLPECGEVHILATSREALGITGEMVWSVPALTVPDTEPLPERQATLLQGLMGYESVQLFVERAQAAQQSFALSGHNAPMVAQACRQLEGIPLAIELAAAQIRAMSVEQIAAGLDNELGLLTGGNRGAHTRQQTLRTTLDWSYALLTEAERLLLKRLSVFAGGCLLEAAEEVCHEAGIEAGQVLGLLTSLVDKSLVLFEEREGAGGRYRLLEMVRQYAAEGLQASGEAETIRNRHLAWYTVRAEEADPELRGPEQIEWLQRLEVEHDNFRSAIAWCETGRVNAQAALRLVGTLINFWLRRGYFDLGRAYLMRALNRADASQPTEVRARALSGAASLALRQGDYQPARALLEESLEIRRQSGNKAGIAATLNNMGEMCRQQGDLATARRLLEECIAIKRELGDIRSLTSSLHNLGMVASNQGDYEAAVALFEECLTIKQTYGDKRGIGASLLDMGTIAFDQGDLRAARTRYEESLAIGREVEDSIMIATSLNNLAMIAREYADFETARTLYEESLTIHREVGYRRGIAVTLHCLGVVANDQGDYREARSWYAQSLTVVQELGDRSGIADTLEGFGNLASSQGLPEQAVRLWGAEEALREEIGVPWPPLERERRGSRVAAAQEALGEATFAAAWQEGRAMTLEQAILHALEGVPA